MPEPDRVERPAGPGHVTDGAVESWTIHVCEACGDYGFVFGSQHSIPILECGSGGEHAWEHVGPYRTVEVVPAARERSTNQWYAVRIKRLRDLAKEHGLWEEAACILANGTADPAEPPTYDQILNVTKHRVGELEALVLTAREAEIAAGAMRDHYRDSLDGSPIGQSIMAKLRARAAEEGR